MTPWDLDETYRLVQRVFGRDQEKLTRESARSITDRRDFSSYHFAEAMRLSKAFEKKHLSDTKTILEIHAQGAEKKERAFQVFMVRAGAHSVAAVQSLHAIPDILAHAIYFASGQNLQPYALDDSKIAVQTVVSCIKKDTHFAPLSSALEAIQSGHGWRHLAAVSNTSKHRSVVRAAYNEDWIGARETFRLLHVSAFNRNGKSYPAVSLRDLLEPEYERIMRVVILVGNELNSCLRSAAT